MQHAGVVFAANGFPVHVYYGFPGDHPAVNKARRFKAVTGACLLVRRRVFEQLGGLDPAFHNVYEDVDLCLRALEAGREVHYCPESVAYHLQSVTRGDPAAPTTPADPLGDHRRSFGYYHMRWSQRVEA